MIAIVEDGAPNAVRVRQALVGRFHEVRSFPELSMALDRAAVAAVVCDPRGVPDEQVLALVDKALRLRKRAFMVAEPTQRVADVTLRAASRGLTGASFCGCPLDSARLRLHLSSAPDEVSLPVRILATASDALWKLPPRLRGELVMYAMTVCHGSLDVHSLAYRAGGSARSLARWMAAADLREPRETLAALRIGHLWPDLWKPAVSIAELARLAGYSSERTMRAHCRRLLGWSPSHVRRFLTVRDIAAALGSTVRRSATLLQS